MRLIISSRAYSINNVYSIHCILRFAFCSLFVGTVICCIDSASCCYLRRINLNGRTSVWKHQFAKYHRGGMFSFKKWLADHQVSEEVRESMLREYSILLYIGGLFMNYEPKFAVLSLVQFSIFFFNNLLYIVIFVVTSFKAPSLIGLSQYLNYLSLAIISLGIYTTAFSHRDTVIRQLEILARDFYDYGSTFDNKDAATWKADLRKFKIIILIAIPSYLAIIGVCVLFANWIDLLFGYETDDIEYKGDIYQKSPIPLWHPYYIDSGITRYVSRARSSNF